jgi:hypothetical protein
MSNYHGRIMNVDYRRSGEKLMFADSSETMAYKEGHRDARHAAAEIAGEAEEEIDELKGELAKKNEAIRKIANMSFDEYHPEIGWMHHYKGSIYEAVGIARNVLGYSLQGIIPQEEYEQAIQGEEE